MAYAQIIEPADSSKVRFVDRKLADMGAELPFGTFNQLTGAIDKTLIAKRWNFAAEKRLAKIKEQHKTVNAARFVSLVLGSIMRQIGAITMPDDDNSKSKEFSLVFGSLGAMLASDVLYAYLWLRRETIGDNFIMEAPCVGCNTMLRTNLSIGDLDVHCFDRLEDAIWEYKLLVPFDVRGKRVESLKVGPYRWSALESSPAGGLNFGTTKALIIRSSIYEAGDFKVVTDSDIDEMDKRDIEALMREIDRNQPGPEMAYKVECDLCRTENKRAIDWTFESFFGASGVS